MSISERLKGLEYWVIIILILYFGKALFIPIGFSVFIGFILYPPCKWLEGKRIPRGIAITVSLLLLIIPFAGLLLLLIKQFFQLSDQFQDLYTKLPGGFYKLIESLANLLGIPKDSFLTWLKNSLTTFDIVTLIKNTITISSVTVIIFILIPVYVALLLYYRKNFVMALSYIFPNYGTEQIKSILIEASNTYYRFIIGMIFVYLIVGILNSLGLLLLNIPNPILLGFIASLLTIIPYIGISIGTVVPMSVAYLNHESIWYPIGVIIIFSIVQILEAYVIFPIAVGNRLEINPLVILIAIIAGGIMWGVSGMILFIPAIGVLKIISDRIPSLKPISYILKRKIDQ